MHFTGQFRAATRLAVVRVLASPPYRASSREPRWNQEAARRYRIICLVPGCGHSSRASFRCVAVHLSDGLRDPFRRSRVIPRRGRNPCLKCSQPQGARNVSVPTVPIKLGNAAHSEQTGLWRCCRRSNRRYRTGLVRHRRSLVVALARVSDQLCAEM